MNKRSPWIYAPAALFAVLAGGGIVLAVNDASGASPAPSIGAVPVPEPVAVSDTATLKPVEVPPVASPQPSPPPAVQQTSQITLNGKEMNPDNAPSGSVQDGGSSVTWSNQSGSSSLSVHSTDGSVSTFISSGSE